MAPLPSQEEAEAAQASVFCSYAIMGVLCWAHAVPRGFISDAGSWVGSGRVSSVLCSIAIASHVWHAAGAIATLGIDASPDFKACSGELPLAGEHPSGSADRACDGDAVWDAAGAAAGRLQGVAGGARAHAPGQLAQVGHAQRGPAPLGLPPPLCLSDLGMDDCDHAEVHSRRPTVLCHAQQQRFHAWRGIAPT